MNTLKRLMYNKLKSKMTKQARQFYGIPNLECYAIKMEALHASDILITTNFIKNGGDHKETLKLSEHSDTLDMFLGEVHKQLGNLKTPIYSALTITYEAHTEELEIKYINTLDKPNFHKQTAKY